jgi:DNA (cytosine-5)-methyltransferase 1
MEKAGHECVYSIEWDKHKRRIYNVIFGKEPEGSDIRRVSANDIPTADCWCFGFPCQDISVAGKQLGLEGERSGLFYEVIRLIRGKEKNKEAKPKYLFIENVKNLLSVNDGWDFLNLLYTLDEVGYDAQWQLLNSKDFGVPHNRERVYIIGNLRGECPRKVFPIERSNAVFEESRGQREIEGEDIVTTITKNYHKGVHSGGETYIRQIGNCMPGTKRNNPNQGRIYDINGISPCLGKMEGGGRQPHIIENDKIRRLTPRECWRLQGIPDDLTDKVIKSGVSDTQMYIGAGDACTVNVIYEIAKRLNEGE